jgi:hypothetical protein
MAYYGITTSANEVAPDTYVDWCALESDAQASAVEFAKRDKATYYVHLVSVKPIFKATVVQTVDTEVMS